VSGDTKRVLRYKVHEPMLETRRNERRARSTECGCQGVGERECSDIDTSHPSGHVVDFSIMMLHGTPFDDDSYSPVRWKSRYIAIHNQNPEKKKNASSPVGTSHSSRALLLNMLLALFNRYEPLFTGETKRNQSINRATK
jgi:hypothetical protein